MFIKNGQADIASSRSTISDISELINSEKTNMPAVTARRLKRPNSSESSGGLFEYLSNRKYYIFALLAIYILGTVIGVMLINNLERAEIINLCLLVDEYFIDLPGINMTARVLGNIAVNLVFIFVAYLCGVTIFAPLVCSAFSLYKGLSAGFIIGVYIMGGGTSFHLITGGINFILNLFVMIFFVLVCAEAMSFASFLFKSEESFKSSMSFKNISVYSSRFIVLTVLIALATFVQTIAVPLVYAAVG